MEVGHTGEQPDKCMTEENQFCVLTWEGYFLCQETEGYKKMQNNGDGKRENDLGIVV